MSKVAVRPCFARPDTESTSVAGLTWWYTNARGEKLATVYASRVFGGCAADMPSRTDLGKAACLVVGGGLPALPLTARHRDHPLSFVEVCAEVEALLEGAGFRMVAYPIHLGM